MFRFLTHPLACLACLASPAAALDWTLDPAQSDLTFTYTENGRPFEGRFPAFSGNAFFDPELFEGTDVALEVRTEAVELPDFVRTGFAKSSAWFDTSNYPTSQVTIDEITRNEDGTLTATGTLTVKGRSFPIAPVMSLEAEGRCLTASGTFPMRIKDYGIGEDALSRTIRVGETVDIAFRLTGYPQGRPGPC